MKLARRLAVLAALLICLGLSQEASRAERPEEYYECVQNAENYYEYICLNQCAMTGGSWQCQYSCYRNYQSMLENCDRFYPDNP